MTTLLEAVDALTQPIPLKTITQKRRDGQFVVDGRGNPIMTVVKTTLPALLDQLEEAVTSSMGGTTKGGSLGSTRNVLNAAALDQAFTIRDRIREWGVIVDARLAGTLSERLRAWHAATLSRNLTVTDTDFYVGVLLGWKNFISNTLDPARELDLPWECPVCGADTWWDGGLEYRRPLVIRYRPGGPDTVQHARALCKACEHVWGVRELAYALEHPELIPDAS